MDRKNGSIADIRIWYNEGMLLRSKIPIVFFSAGLLNSVAVAALRLYVMPGWYENPWVEASTQLNISNSSTFGAWHMNGEDDYVAATGWQEDDGMLVFRFSDLAHYNASPIASNKFDHAIAGSCGAAVSSELNVVLVGSGATGVAIAYPLDKYSGTVGTDSFLIENDQGIAFNDLKFTRDGQFLYTDGIDGDRFIYKFRVLDGLKSSGTNLVCVAKFDMGQAVHSFDLGEFDQGDVLYALLDDRSVRYIDARSVESTAEELVPGYRAVDVFGDISVADSYSWESVITIVSAARNGDPENVNHPKSLDVFSLRESGLGVESQTPLLSLDADGCADIGLPETCMYGFSAYMNLAVTAMVLAWDNHLYFISFTSPSHVVSWTGSENVTVSYRNEKVLSGDSAKLPESEYLVFYPTCGSITNVNGNKVDDLGGYTYYITTASTQTVVVLAGKREKPEWANASGDGSRWDPYWEWAEIHGAGRDLFAKDYSSQYLLNVDADKEAELSVERIEMEDGAVTLTIAARIDGEVSGMFQSGQVYYYIYGELIINVSDDLVNWRACNIPYANFRVNPDGTARVTILETDGSFFKPSVEFQYAQDDLTPLEE